jgi:hypothetical protein
MQGFEFAPHRLTQSELGSMRPIEGGTHAVPFEKPKLVNSNILRFLDE